MKNFKTQDGRLARIFRDGRNKWKQKAADRHKENRALEVKVRDLLESRTRWRDLAQKLQDEVKQLQQDEKLNGIEVKKKGRGPTTPSTYCQHRVLPSTGRASLWYVHYSTSNTNCNRGAW